MHRCCRCTGVKIQGEGKRGREEDRIKKIRKKIASGKERDVEGRKTKGKMLSKG